MTSRYYRSSSGFAVFLAVIAVWCVRFVVAQTSTGSWELLISDVGIAPMHTAITRFDTAILLDRTNVGPTHILLSNRTGCRDQPLEQISVIDCYAHSVMFNPSSKTVRPLYIFTDTWCSSGQFMADGTLVQTGGDFEGLYKIRRLTPCRPNGYCDWVEDNTNELTDPRWYSTNQILPDGQTQIIVGGRNAPTYEFVPKRTSNEGTFKLAVLDVDSDNLYPYVVLLPDGNLWIFAARDSVLLNYETGEVLDNYPTIPGNTRNYPAAGSATLLPLSWETGFQVAEVLVCGGASSGYNADLPASTSCGRMTLSSPQNATWEMEDMPVARVMGDMTLLPTGDVLIINGAQVGSQGWGMASDPAFQPCLYATNDSTNRFQLLAATTIARVYHSTANLLSDGRILVAGSNTHQFYTYNNTDFPTEMRVEAFSPPYLSTDYNSQRPVLTGWPNSMSYAHTYMVTYVVGINRRFLSFNTVVECNLLSSPFVTHSFAQGQRLLKLKTEVMNVVVARTLFVTAPPNSNIAPPQYYMLFVVQDGIPSGKAQWVQITN